MNTTKKFLLASILLGIVFLLIAQSMFSVEASVIQQPKPSPTPEVLENGWLRFTDSEAGYYFDYPPEDVYITFGKNKGEKYNHVFIQFVAVRGNGSQGMVLIVEPNSKKLSVEEFLLEYYSIKTKKSPSPSLSKNELGEFINLDGQTAIKTHLITSHLATSFSFHVIFVNGDKAYISGPVVSAMGGSEIAPDTEKLFMEILDTLTFLP